MSLNIRIEKLNILKTVRKQIGNKARRKVARSQTPPTTGLSIRFDYEVSWIDGCTDVSGTLTAAAGCTGFVLDTWESCNAENQDAGSWKATPCTNVTMDPVYVWA